MDVAGEADPAAAAKIEAARRRVEDCHARLARYRSALDAGADPIVVAGWMKDVEAERRAAERSLLAIADAPRRFSREELREVIEEMDVVTALAGAAPALKADLYDALGIKLTYRPAEQVVEVEAQPACRTDGVGGGT